MNKMMIALVTVAVALASEAATFSWQLTSAADYVGKDAYVFDSVQRTAVVEALTAGGDNVAATVTALAIGGPAKAEGRSGKEKFDSFGVYANETPTSYSAFWILFDSTIADGNTYSISGDVNVTDYISMAGSGGKDAYATTAAATFTTTGQKIGPTQTPEPTSGILLVLGMAGLALRRRRT